MAASDLDLGAVEGRGVAGATDTVKMAGDWIKLEHTTPDKPEVVTLAALLQIDQDAVTGKLFRIWAWADQNSLSGVPVSITGAFLDRLTSCKGFAAALRAVGWLSGDDGNLLFPNFERHNGMTAKERALVNRRMAKSRAVTLAASHEMPKRADVVTLAASQKPNKNRNQRREEKSTNTGTYKPPGREPLARAGGTLAELEAYAVEIGLPASDGTACFEKWEGNGWTNKGAPIRDWRATMRSWKRQGFLDSQKAATKAGRSPPRDPNAIPRNERTKTI